MAFTYEVDDKTGKPTGGFVTREQGERYESWLPVGVGIVTDVDSRILVTTRAKNKQILGGARFYGIGEHGKASLNESEEYDCTFSYPKEVATQIRRERFYYESPRRMVSRGILEELRPGRLYEMRKEEAIRVLMNEVYNLGVKIPIDLTAHSKSTSKKQVHYIFGFIYDQTIHGELNPIRSEFEKCEWEEINFEEIFSSLENLVSVEYIKRMTTAVHRLRQRNVSFLSIRRLENFRRHRSFIRRKIKGASRTAAVI